MTDNENNPDNHLIPNAGIMKSHNDWATAPPPISEAEKLLWKTYYRQLAEIQISIHHDRATRLTDKIQRYFNSTQTKNTLARVLCLSFYDNTLDSVSGISQKIFASRQATLQMLNDCVAEGWAKCDNGSPKRYSATQVLVNAFELYAGFHMARCEDSGVFQAHAALKHYIDLADKLVTKNRQVS